MIGHRGFLRVWGSGNVWGIYSRASFFGSEAAPLSLGQIAPRVTIAKGKSFIPRVRNYVKHSIVCCFKTTTTNMSACTVVTLHWQCLH